MSDRPLLAGDGLTDATLSESALRFQFELAPSGRHPDILLAASISKDNLPLLLARTEKAVLEAPCPEPSPIFKDIMGGKGLYLSISTRAAFDLPLSLEFCIAIWERLPAFSVHRREKVEFALQEAIANALVHGNLGVPGSLKESAQGFETYCAMLSERLLDAAYADRRLEIAGLFLNGQSMKLTITDQGEGFVICEESLEQACSKTGRGMAFLRELSDQMQIDDNGRRVNLFFHDEGDQA
jgi:anti-sigma regulatory factor (Ser/Thr protein kinase)